MSLSTRLAEHVRACFAGLWVQSHEHEDALVEIAQLCREEDWSLATWDIDRGLHVAGSETATTANDSLSAVRALSALTQPEQPVLLILTNFHRFLSSAEVVQALAHQKISIGADICFDRAGTAQAATSTPAAAPGWHRLNRATPTQRRTHDANEKASTGDSRGNCMTARHKLNVAHFQGALLVAGLIGIFAGSIKWFLLALVTLVAGGIYAGEIRPSRSRCHDQAPGLHARRAAATSFHGGHHAGRFAQCEWFVAGLSCDQATGRHGVRLST